MNLRDSPVRWQTFDAARVGLKPYAIEQDLKTDCQIDRQNQTQIYLRNRTVRWRTFDAGRVGLKPYAIEQDLKTLLKYLQTSNPDELAK